MRMLRAIKNFFSTKKVDFNDPVDPAFISNRNIPDVIFERNVMLYNCGYDKHNRVYKVIINPLTKELDV